ncbi:hypothetical protein [Variovorax sp. PMC12]|uniref:hypothetical protein n=1 Tax=Variovorax sp. PMC12 TaxID=2126319 RepID=UPI000D1336CA|nr:hypothetical protein [Variovorax sp. PMC12]AVQ84277.1 hypothetical protein C4F17_26855 [Variovorax sp. PMC12]
MEQGLDQTTWRGIDPGGPEGDRTVYLIPASAEADLRQFFGGALPDWIMVLAKLPASKTMGGPQNP